MKKMLLGVFFLMFMTSQAFAFVPEMSIFVNREVATARVFNSSYAPIICSGMTYGQTYSGLTLNAWFSNLYVAPGGYADAYVYSNYYDPFMNAWAQVDCRYGW